VIGTGIYNEPVDRDNVRVAIENGVFYIDYNTLGGVVKIFDLTGCLVRSYDVDGSGRIEVKGLSRGVYFVRMENSAGRGILKKVVLF